MRNRIFQNSIILFAVIPLMTSCLALLCMSNGMDVVCGFEIQNNSDQNIYVVVDYENADNTITAGSKVLKILSGQENFVETKAKPDRVVEDSLHLYIFDMQKIHLQDNTDLTEKDISCIAEGDILDVITVTLDDIYNMPAITYPQAK